MKALEELYKKYRLDIYRYLFGLTHNADVAEDLLSECFLAAVKGLPFFRGESTVKTWLFAIARNCWLKQLKRQRKEVALSDMVEIYIADDVSGQIINKQLCQRVLALLKHHDERSQNVVMMRVEGYSYRDISKALSISEGSARVIDHRAKKRLRELLKKEGYEIDGK